MFTIDAIWARIWGALRPGDRPIPDGLKDKYDEILSNPRMKGWREDKINMRRDVMAVRRDFQLSYQKVCEEVMGHEAY